MQNVRSSLTRLGSKVLSYRGELVRFPRGHTVLTFGEIGLNVRTRFDVSEPFHINLDVVRISHVDDGALPSS